MGWGEGEEGGKGELARHKDGDDDAIGNRASSASSLRLPSAFRPLLYSAWQQEMMALAADRRVQAVAHTSAGAAKASPDEAWDLWLASDFFTARNLYR